MKLGHTNEEQRLVKEGEKGLSLTTFCGVYSSICADVECPTPLPTVNTSALELQISNIGEGDQEANHLLAFSFSRIEI